MQFFFLLLFNVFLGAVLYLVISLKLERSASEFRERRFRKEMDEIIKEFNITAERNITLLEGKIRLLRMLLEKNGDLRSLDVTLEEEERTSAAEEDSRAAEQPRAEREIALPVIPARAEEGETGSPAALIKKGLLLLFDKVIPITHRSSDRARPEEYLDERVIPAEAVSTEKSPREAVRQRGTGAIIEKDLGVALAANAAKPEKKLVTEKDILDIVAKAEDRYQLIALLSEQGCEIEEISRYSGMSAGEVRLVLNLSREAPQSPC